MEPVERSQVPLSDQRGLVAGVPEESGPDGRRGIESQLRFVTGMDPVGDAHLGAVPAADQAGPGRAADGSDGKVVGEVGPFAEEAIEVGGAGIRIARLAEGPRGLIVGEDEQDVRAFCGTGDGGPQEDEGRQGQHQGEEAAHRRFLDQCDRSADVHV